jgi:hypothetical protein
MAGLIIFDPENDNVGLSTGDDIAVGTYLDVATDSMYFTDALNIYQWEGDEDGQLQTYTWKSAEIRTPYPINLGAAIVEAENYTLTVGDPYWNNVLFMAKWEGVDEATTYTELKQSQVLTMYGNAQLDIDQVKWGDSSLQLDGTGDAAQTPSADGSDTQIPSDTDFTVDGWFYLNTLPGVGNEMTLIAQSSSSATNFRVAIRNIASVYYLSLKIAGTWYDSTDITSDLTTSAWHHFYVNKKIDVTPGVDTVYFGMDGDGFGGVTSTANPDSANLVPITVGGYDDAVNQTFTNTLDGYIDDIRLTSGTARYYPYAATYTEPTEGFSSVVATYDITFNLYAEDVLKHTQTVTSNEPFRLPGGYLSGVYAVEIVSALPVTRVSVAENIFELAEG